MKVSTAQVYYLTNVCFQLILEYATFLPNLEPHQEPLIDIITLLSFQGDN